MINNHTHLKDKYFSTHRHTQFKKGYVFKRKKTSMSTKITPALLRLPVEIVYRILDHLEIPTILLSFRNVCTQLNTIIDTYHRYQVNFIFIFKLLIYHQNTTHLNSILTVHLFCLQHSEYVISDRKKQLILYQRCRKCFFPTHESPNPELVVLWMESYSTRYLFLTHGSQGWVE